MRQRFSFDAHLVIGFRGWIGVELPSNSSAYLATRRQVAVAGTINGRAFRSTATPSGQGHFLWINQTLRGQLKLQVGDRVQVSLEPKHRRSSVPIPKELDEALDSQPAARKWWGGLSPAKQRIATEWIGHAKSSEVRVYRASDVLRRARRTFLKEGPFYPTKEDQIHLSRPKGRSGGTVPEAR
jgi:hypothetical protein